jgi:hypothetical protein
MLPKYLTRPVDTPKQKSQKQERRIAKKGFVQPGSGSVWPYKGDVSFPDVLVEAKRTDKKSMAVQGEWLKKIFEEAIMAGKEAGIELEIGDYRIQGFVTRK